MKAKLDAAQKGSLIDLARLLQDHEDRDVLLEARIPVAERVEEWLTAARQAALKGRVAVAESLYHRALAYSPGSKKAKLRLGRFYYYNDQQDRGFQVLCHVYRPGDVFRGLPRRSSPGKPESGLWSTS